MKRILTLGLVLISVASFAQSTSLGLRTGVNVLKNKSEGCRSGVSAWSNEAYFRQRTKSKFAFEGGINYAATGRRNIQPMIENGFEAPAFKTTSIKQNTQFIAATVGLQYDVTCPAMQSCPVLKRLKSYVGIRVSPTINVYNTESNVQKISDGSNSVVNNQRSDYTIWTGLTHTMVYNFCCRYYISSEAQLKMDPNSFFSKSANEDLNTGASFQIGVGYKL